jgi:hypothetical protein
MITKKKERPKDNPPPAAARVPLVTPIQMATSKTPLDGQHPGRPGGLARDRAPSPARGCKRCKPAHYGPGRC